MAHIMIKCPATGKAVSTMMGATAESFETMQLNNNTITPCPACGGTHTWSKSDAFLQE